MTRAELMKLREMLKKASLSLTDEEALECPQFFPKYQVGRVYAVDDRFTYNGELYKVVQAHTSQEDWIPSEVSALYVHIAPPDVVPVWTQPLGPQDAYQTGDKVHYPTINDPIYMSKIDNNVWSPDAYPAGWELEV